jgi:hypothetical protein
MGQFATPHHLVLSQSFRFGPQIAEEANKWLDLIGTPLRLTGTPTIDSTVSTDITGPDAVLCRTNGGVIAQVMAAHKRGERVAIVGDGTDARRLAEAADQLQNGRSTTHPELALFPTWTAVQEYVGGGDGADMKPFVDLIDEHGPDVIIDAIDATVHESSAQVVVSTSHKAKGREWARVQLDSDFRQPRTDPVTGEDEIPGVDEAMLSYVSVTRAQRALGRGVLEWVDKHTNYKPGAVLPPTTTVTPALPTRPAPGPSEAGELPDPWADLEHPTTAQLVIDLPADLADWLTSQAEQRNTSTSELVELLVRARREGTF